MHLAVRSSFRGAKYETANAGAGLEEDVLGVALATGEEKRKQIQVWAGDGYGLQPGWLEAWMSRHCP